MRQLANAGLIEGSYAGYYIGYWGHAPGQNIPISKIGSNGGVAIQSLAPGDLNYTTTLYFTGDFGNSIAVGQMDYTGTLLPEEAWNIDTKLDDGKPGQGVVIANWPTCTTASGTTDYSANYNLTVKTKACNIGRKSAI